MVRPAHGRHAAARAARRRRGRAGERLGVRRQPRRRRRWRAGALRRAGRLRGRRVRDGRTRARVRPPCTRSIWARAALAVAPWPAAGLAAARRTPPRRPAPALASDGAGGLFLVWHDARDFGRTARTSTRRASTRTLRIPRLVASGTAVRTAAAGAARRARDGGRRAARSSRGPTRARARRAAPTSRWPRSAPAGRPRRPCTRSRRRTTTARRSSRGRLRVTNWKYRVYRSAAPIASTADLATATLVGSVGDSSVRPAPGRRA